MTPQTLEDAIRELDDAKRRLCHVLYMGGDCTENDHTAALINAAAYEIERIRAAKESETAFLKADAGYRVKQMEKRANKWREGFESFKRMYNATIERLNNAEMEVDRLTGEANSHRSLVAAYAALEPNWDEAPEWATHYFIKDSMGTWSKGEPVPYPDVMLWSYRNVTFTAGHKPVNLPLGIDWRLCKWQRPEVSA